MTSPTVPLLATSDGGPPSIDSVMARLADGDTAAVVTLNTHFGPQITGVVRRHLRSLGRYTTSPEELSELVWEACFAIAEAAGGWRPGGAKPWTWADARIRSEVARWLGIFAAPLDGAEHRIAEDSIPAPCTDESVAETFARLVAEEEHVALLAQAARTAGLDEVTLVQWLDYRICQDSGDPSPAHTVGQLHNLKPDAVRQRVSRARRRVADVIERDPRFAALAGLRLVA